MIVTLFKLKRLLRQGFRSLSDHKLRSFLTALGIIFGVSSVIAMLAIGEGASYEAREQIRRLGSTNVIIRSRKPVEKTSAGNQTQRMSIYGLTYEDALRIQTLFPQVQVQVPARIITQKIRQGAASLPAEIFGTVPWYLKNSGLQLNQGRFIDAEDVRGIANVCVLETSTARQLFPVDWPLGRTVYLGSAAYTIVGLVEKHARSESSRQEVHRVYIPISSARKRFGEVLIKSETGTRAFEKVELHELTLTAENNEQVVALADAVRSMLNNFHRQEDFEIVVPLELLRQAEETKRIFNLVLGSIAAISLLVGGIGIMNIMLASVTERTREIGIRRALGATRGDIVIQFLTEAMILSLAGGLLGVALGVAIPLIVSRVAGLAAIILPSSIILAFVISVLTGLLFGIYPAGRAAVMPPIEALRHE